MLRLPIVLPDALRFLRLPVPAATDISLPSVVRGALRDQGLVLFASLSPKATLLEWKRPGLSSSWGTPVYVPCSQTPAGPSRQADCGASVQPSALGTASAPAIRFFRGSITRPPHPLSTLRRMDHSTTTQDSLPAAGQALPGRMLTPAGFQRKVSTMSHNIASPFPKLS